MLQNKLHYTVFLIFLVTQFSFSQVKRKSLHPFSNSVIGTVETGTNYSFSDYENSDLGWLASVKLDYYFKTHSKSIFGIGLNGGIQNLTAKNNYLGLPEKFNTGVFNGGFEIIYSYALGNVLPFISVGSSFYLFDFSTKNIKSRFYDITNGGKNNSIEVEGFTGLKYRIAENTAIDLKLGYHQVLNDNIDAIATGKYNDFFVTAGIGISYALWKRIDSDNDGIPDNIDKCPYEAEDLDGYQDEDGCPDIDNDKDGIIDIKDGCPNAKEDFDGFQDSDGCPDVDNDGDGILDVIDKCPNKKEDFDGFQDKDGCPDIDNDNDGILDVNDKCPNEAEIFNGYKDDDGCPDEVPTYIPQKKYRPKKRKTIKIKPKTKKKKETKIIEEKKNIPSRFLLRGESIFISGSSQIKSSAFNKLNGIAEKIKSDPYSQWDIEAHVDKANSAAEALKLSRSQALAVKRYLISQGIPSENLRAIGMGDSVPIASNNSVYGRMKNRRIIIRKIK